MSDYEPPPLDYDEPPLPDFDDWAPPMDAYDEPPPLDLDYDYTLEPEPYLPPPADEDFIPIPDDFVPEGGIALPDFPPPEQDGLQGFETPEPEDENWSWHDARLIGIDHGDDAGENRYEVGAIDLYADAETGDLGGQYLPIATFGDDAPALAYYNNLQEHIHNDSLTSHALREFAETRSAEMGTETPTWRGAEGVEYEAYEYLRDLEAFDPALADVPPDEALDPLLQTALELGGVLVERDVETTIDERVVQTLQENADVLASIGVQVDRGDTEGNPPPYYDEATGTAYWIGVFQPDEGDRDNCVTSILSLGRNPETGEMEAQLAPCVPGNWDKTYAAAEHLIEVAGRGGIEQVFDTAEGMALATDQRELWQRERGVPLEADTTQTIADYAQNNWEVEL